MNATSHTHTTGTLTKYTRWLSRLFALLAFLVGGLSFTAPSAKAASLDGETVQLTVRYQTTTQESVSIDQALFTSAPFVVGAGQEVPSTAVTFTYTSGGFPQTISGNISANISATGMVATFSGTQQPGGLLFILSSVADQSAGQVTAATLTGSSGFQNGVNQTLDPTFSNNGTGSVTSNFFLGGFQPGVSLSETISFTLADPVAPVLTNLNGDTVSYTGAPVVVDNQTSPNLGLSITDNDAPSEANMGGATMTITNLQAGDVLSVTPTVPITASYLNGVLTL